MSAVKVAVACGLVALLISACGVAPKPVAGTTNLRKHSGYYGLRDDPRVKHLPCLRSAKIHFREYYTGKQRLPSIQIGTPPSGPTIVFYPTPGIAQGLQIMGEEQGAEVVGSALLYPNGASAKELTTIEACVASGVTG
ncbi:MAG TPA: hypothetical protein VG293_05175 [Solirubrobacteraceae bacterium]|jgi:hypothetical protein|nr:hypothetical protein [Solirubrobacteraceae bacterium]